MAQLIKSFAGTPSQITTAFNDFFNDGAIVNTVIDSHCTGSNNNYVFSICYATGNAMSLVLFSSTGNNNSVNTDGNNFISDSENTPLSIFVLDNSDNLGVTLFYLTRV